MQNGAPVVTQASSGQTRGYFEYPHRKTTIAGFVLIGLGALAMILQTAALMIRSPYTHLYPGIWCGFFYILNGVIGIRAARERTRTMILTFLTTSVALAVVSIALFTIPRVELEFSKQTFNDSRVIGLNATLVVIGILATILHAGMAYLSGRWICDFAFDDHTVAVVERPAVEHTNNIYLG